MNSESNTFQAEIDKAIDGVYRDQFDESTFCANINPYDIFDCDIVYEAACITDFRALSTCMELPDWESYWDIELLEAAGISETRADEISNRSSPSLDEYKAFISTWVSTFIETIELDVAYIYETKHTDGRVAYISILAGECGQGGYESASDVYQGMFISKSDALKCIHNLGITDDYTVENLSKFANAIALQIVEQA